MIVVDASIVAKWFLPEADSDRAAAMLQGERIGAPELVRVEVASAITRRVRLGELSGPFAVAACAAWDQALVSGVVTLSPNEVDLSRAVELAIELEHPLQDCLYLAAAVRQHASLVTGDIRFLEKARTVYPHARSLA